MKQCQFTNRVRKTVLKKSAERCSEIEGSGYLPLSLFLAKDAVRPIGRILTQHKSQITQQFQSKEPLRKKNGNKDTSHD